MPIVRRKIKINEVSLCRHPANAGARITLWKSEDGGASREMDRLTKGQIYEEANARAEHLRKDGENIHVALGRFWQTDDGRKLRHSMEKAGRAVTTLPDSRGAAGSLKLPALKKATEAAQQLCAGRLELTLEQARAAVWKGDPDLRDRYDRERAALLT